MELIPRIGIGIIIVKEGKVLLGKRRNAFGEGSWCFPGGHLEFNEELKDCAERETLEETGIKIKNIRYTTITNDISPLENKHYLTVFMQAEFHSGEVQLKEPKRFERWGWFRWEDLPAPLFLPIQNLLKQNFNPFHH